MSKLSLREIAQSQLDSTPVIDGQLIVCLDTGNAYRDTATAHVKIGSDLEVVSDLPLAPLAEKLYYLKPDKLYVFLGGNWTLLNDKTIDLDESIAKLPAGDSTSLNDDVEIITQDTDITQSHYYRRKLVVLWEYIKTKTQDFFAAKDHKHKKADITDFPISMPASDVYPWAKATTKPSYTKAEVGLGKVDNIADADKTVKRATTAGTADSANSVAWGNVRDKPTTFPVEAHNHDDRYYTEAEMDGKLEKKSPTDHTHDLSELISGLSIGNSTTLNDSVQIITQDTNTANQKYYRRPLTVLWDYIKSKADSVYSAIEHNHKIQNLEEYTTRVYDATIVRPADTVLASPQDKDGLATFRKLDKNDVGLENVDNTADKNKNVATAGIATMGVRDYNNESNIIKIGWTGADLDANTLAYVAGYTSDKKIHTASKDGVRSWLGLGDSAYKNTKSRSNKGSTDWTNNATDDAIVPTMSFMAYWDGAYNSNGASNLSYCDRGRFGTIVTKNSGDYLPVSGGTMSGALNFANDTWNHVGDDVQIGDHNTSGSFYIQGLNGATNIKLKKKGDTSAGSGNSATITYDGGNLIIDKTIQANLNGTADKANSVDWSKIQNKPSSYPPSSHTHNYAGSASAGGAAISANSLNPTVTLIGGNGNVSGYRLIGQVSIGQWSNYRCVMIVKSRHQGAGIVSVCMGNNTSTISQANAYSEIKYWGPQNSGSVIHGDAYKVYISADGKTGYLFWQYSDYSNTEAYVISSDFTISNGTWMTSIGSGYGSLWSRTQINAASTANNASTAEVATTGVRDYNNANNTIKIGWSGTDLDENTLAYIAGYTSDMKIHTASKAGVRSWIGQVASATSADNGVTASGKNGAGIYYVRFGNGTQMCWGFYKESDHSGSTSFPVAFNNSQYSISLTVTVSSNNAPYITGRSTTGFSYARHGTSYNDVQWIAVGTWK